jgi:hypothetical protein
MQRQRRLTTIGGVTSRMKYVPALCTMYVTSVMMRQAQQTEALSSRRCITGCARQLRVSKWEAMREHSSHSNNTARPSLLHSPAVLPYSSDD